VNDCCFLGTDQYIMTERAGSFEIQTVEEW